MPIMRVHRTTDFYLRDKNLSLSAIKFLKLVLNNNITNGLEIENFCIDSKEDIKDTC